MFKTTLLLAALIAPQLGSNAQSVVTDDPALRPGDHVRITVLSDDKDLSGEFEVAPDSTLKHPIYNKVKVAGVPVSQLREKLASFLRKFQREPQLEVEPLFKVTIAGEVRTPNIYLLPPETTVSDALLRAGGTTDRANLDKIAITRDGHGLPAASFNRETLTVHSGDQISVGSRRSVTAGFSSLAPIIGVTASLLSATLLIMSHHR